MSFFYLTEQEIIMKIHLSTSMGTGPTTLAAFDAALNNAGIANYNLLRLSSVIPPKSELIQHGENTIPQDVMPGEWGDRLYVVMAEQRVAVPNTEAWAGIGWVQDSKTKKGLFVEHEGESEKRVREDITESLQALMKTRGVDFGDIHMIVAGGQCEDRPICAMAVAVYQASDWENGAYLIK
jgi:arginine decarboxylase